MSNRQPLIKKPSSELQLRKNKISFDFSELQEISFPNATKDGKFFISFLCRLKKIGSMDWNLIYSTSKHSFGAESIKVEVLKDAAKNKLSSDITKLTVLRATGDNKAFLGYREENVFKVIFIEYKFGDIYSHG